MMKKQAHQMCTVLYFFIIVDGQVVHRLWGKNGGGGI